MRIRNSLTLSASLASMVVVTGCTNFDREDRIEDTRILAIKTEPAEILYSPLFLTAASQRPAGLPLPTVDVQVEAYAFDPRGGHVKTVAQLCPDLGGDNACRLYDRTTDPKVAAIAEPGRDEVIAALVGQSGEATVPTGVTPVGRIQPTTWDFPFTPSLTDFVIPTDSTGKPSASLFPLLPRFVIDVDNTDQASTAVHHERAFKRFPLTLDITSDQLPANVREQFASALGIKLCAAPIDPFVEGPAPCLQKRAPNQNPSLLGFKVETDISALTRGLVTGTPDIDVGSVVRAHAGQKIGITPVFADGASEQYQTVNFDLNTRAIQLQNATEDLACNWYNTRGDTSRTLTALAFVKGLGVVWTLPDNALAGERDSLVLVVLDQRGGTAVGEITVEYE